MVFFIVVGRPDIKAVVVETVMLPDDGLPPVLPASTPFTPLFEKIRVGLDDVDVEDVVIVAVELAPDFVSASAASINGDDAISMLEKEEQLGVPIVGTERPAMVEHDDLGIARPPILVEDFGPVGGGDGRHGHSPSFKSCSQLRSRYAWVIRRRRPARSRHPRSR